MSKLVYTSASSEDIMGIVMKIEDAINGERKDHIYLACLTIALLMQNPNLEIPDLVSGVQSASEWVATFASNPKSMAGKVN